MASERIWSSSRSGLSLTLLLVMRDISALVVGAVRGHTSRGEVLNGTSSPGTVTQPSFSYSKCVMEFRNVVLMVALLGHRT